LANPLRADAAEQRKRVRAAFDAMVAQADKRDLVDRRLAAVGFCFGGGNVLELARDGADLAAAVSIHGDLKTALPAKRGAIKAGRCWWPMVWRIRWCRRPIATEMNAAGAKWQMVVFSGVLHAYTDQGADVPGVAGCEEAAPRQTCVLTHQFLADAFVARL
jgi:dienelactone hydrolase